LGSVEALENWNRLYAPPPSGVFGWGASMIARPGVKIWPLMMVKFMALAGNIREHNKITIMLFIIEASNQSSIATEESRCEVRKNNRDMLQR
jgi:hypothetical protein